MENRYENNYLTNVICRLDFNPILTLVKNTPDEFQTLLKKDFPILNEQKSIEYRTTIKKDNKTIEENVSPVYSFRNKELKRKITLNYKYVILEFFKYTDFDEFYNCAKKVVDTFIDIYEPTELNRLGLRYVNEIKIDNGNPFDWKDLLEESLTYSVNHFFNDKRALSRSMSQVVLNYDDYKMNFTFGFHNSEYPNKISRKEFVLDFDCYTENYEPAEIFDYLQTFNSDITMKFERAIKDGLREKMGLKNE